MFYGQAFYSLTLVTQPTFRTQQQNNCRMLMRTGFDLLENNEEFDENQIDFLRQTVAIMKVLTQEAMKTSERFTKACGRSQITGNDMYYALMYEAHEFFDKDIDARFTEELAEERTHTYYTDDEDEDDEGNEYEESNENEEKYTIDLIIEKEKEFHTKIIKYANEWRQWFPEDPVKMMIKKSIDSTRQQLRNDE